MADDVKIEKYDKTGYIQYGYRVEMDHYVEDMMPDIAPLVAMGIGTLEQKRLESIASEDKAFEIIGAAINQWKKQASITRACDRALEYLSTPEVEHTGNRWIKDKSNDGEKISNRVYQMSCRIREDTDYDRATKMWMPVAWYVTWDVCVALPRKKIYIQIAGQRNKRYTDKDAARKYVEGRKQAYSHLFAKESPPIPMKYQEYFMVNGLLLPGYTIKGMEKIQFNTGKPSVLEQLNETKPESNAASAPSTEKKKEDIAL